MGSILLKILIVAALWFCVVKPALGSIIAGILSTFAWMRP